ncbi:MFS transporter [Pseudonocardia sp. TRM90224]|uniref:MFS transporter n=1 Tax=Pseudonocardia sp. TRM90224 TaxID=2812678 RepID=UPI001E31A87D|nr:MFS transporter [Pseudonocardia sp. TRM90224]
MLAALATDYALLLVGRAVTALGAVGYLPAVTLVASRLLGPDRHGRAVAIVFGGFASSLVLGVPVGNLLGEAAGYHAVFGLVTMLCVAAAAAVRLLLPPSRCCCQAVTATCPAFARHEGGASSMRIPENGFPDEKGS